MKRLKSFACALFGHIPEISAEKDPFVTTIRCERCGGGARYRWVLDDEFIRRHGLARDERDEDGET